MTSKKRIRGYALAIDHARDNAYFLDGSPVLSPEHVVANENQPRKFQFIENPAARLDTSSCRRVIGDVFVADHGTATFIWQAIREKLARDAEEDAENSFRVFGSDVCEIDGETTLKLAATRLRDSQTLNFDFILESTDRSRQTEGRYLFARLCKAAGITDINDSEELNGHRASVKELPGGSVDFRPAKAAR
ncbi:hypothetical protein [Pararhizobium sp.]|uniref:hypothetical protein n=1 Tax=Pararhizobium sp. TaxID=1977563 RepID=UPI003D0A5067